MDPLEHLLPEKAPFWLVDLTRLTNKKRNNNNQNEKTKTKKTKEFTKREAIQFQNDLAYKPQRARKKRRRSSIGTRTRTRARRVRRTRRDKTHFQKIKINNNNNNNNKNKIKHKKKRKKIRRYFRRLFHLWLTCFDFRHTQTHTQAHRHTDIRDTKNGGPVRLVSSELFTG